MPGYYQNNRLPSQSLPESFELPENRYLGSAGQPAPTPAQGAYQPTLPLAPPAKDLADVEGLTNVYYDIYGKLQALAQGMHKDYNIDITKPDFSAPGGGVPFQTYQRLAGSLMTVSNQLGNKLKAQQQAAPYKYTGQLTGTGEPGDPYVSTHVVPELMEAQRRAEAAFFTSGDAKRAYDANIAPIVAELKAKADATGDPFWKRQYAIAEQLKTTYQTHPTFFRNEFDEQKRKLKAAAGATREMGILRKLTADKEGFWQQGTYELRHDPPTKEDGRNKPGTVYAYKPAEQGVKVDSYVNDDGKTVPRYLAGFKRYEDGSTFAVFKGEEGQQLPEDGKEQRIDTMSGDEFTQILQQANPRYGQTPTMYQAADLMGVSDLGGAINSQKLFDYYEQGGYDKLKGARTELDSAIKQRKGEAQMDAVRQDLEDLSVLPGNNAVDQDTPSGKVVIRKHRLGGGFYIVGEDEKQHLTKDQVIEYLKGKGMFGAGPAQPTAPQVSPEDLARTQQLIQKYSSPANK